jgi:hypothetical protein
MRYFVVIVEELAKRECDVLHDWELTRNYIKLVERTPPCPSLQSLYYLD